MPERIALREGYHLKPRDGNIRVKGDGGAGLKKHIKKNTDLKWRLNV